MILPPFLFISCWIVTNKKKRRKYIKLKKRPSAAPVASTRPNPNPNLSPTATGLEYEPHMLSSQGHRLILISNLRFQHRFCHSNSSICTARVKERTTEKKRGHFGKAEGDQILIARHRLRSEHGSCSNSAVQEYDKSSDTNKQVAPAPAGTGR